MEEVNSVQTFTVMLDQDDLTCLERERPAALNDLVLAFDPDLHVRLKRRAIPHLTPWDVVDRRERAAVYDFESRVWRFWQTHAHALCQGIDLLDLVKYRHVVCFTRFAWAVYVIRRALESLRPAEVVVFDEPNGHGLDQPPDYRKMPMLFALLRGIAEQYGIPTRVLRRELAAGASSFEDRVARRSRRALPPVAPEQALAGRPYVLFSGNDFDLLRQLPLIRALREECDQTVVQLYKSGDARSVRLARQAGHIIWHESQVAGDTPPPECTALAADARRTFDAARQDAPDELRAIFDNPYLGPHFDFIFGEYLRKMVGHVAVWQRFLTRYPPAMLITNYHTPVLDIACRLGVPALVLSHALINVGIDRWFQSLPACLVGAVSETHRAKLGAAGIPAERLCVTGDPSIDDLLARVRANDAVTSAAQAESLRKQLGLSPEQRVVLLCTANPWMPAKAHLVPQTDWADAVRCLEALGRLAARKPQWAFVVKCHPRYDFADLYDSINRSLPVNQRLRVVPDASLASLAQVADAIVLPNSLTSALVEASFWRKPVMILAQSMIWYDAETWMTQHWRHLRSVATLEAELENMFADPRRYQERVRETRAALHHFLGGRPAYSVPRCLEVIDGVLAAGCASGSVSRA
jgi:hypothetical protein